MVFIEGLTLGLSSNLFCAGTCAPVLLPVVLVQKDRLFSQVLKFMGGRLAAYVLFGALSGAAGVYFNGRINPRIFAGFVVLLALSMIIFAFADIRLKLCPAALTGLAGKGIAFYAGFVMGLNLCPPFLIGLSRTLEMGSLLKPVIFFLGFYLGSSAWLILFLFVGKLPSSRYLAAAGRIIAGAVGLWYLRQGVEMLLF